MRRTDTPCSQPAIAVIAGLLLPLDALYDRLLSVSSEYVQSYAGAHETVSAQLLLSAQQKLQEAFLCSLAPHSLTTFSTFSQQPGQPEVCPGFNGF